MIPGDPSLEWKAAAEKPPTPGRLMAGIVAGGCIAGAILIYFFYHQQAEWIQQEQSRALLTVAEIKTRGIASWHRERISDAYSAASNPAFAGFTRDYFAGRAGSSAKQKIQEYFTLLRRIHDYSAIALLDAGGRVRLYDGEEQNREQAVSPAVLEALRQKRVVFEDFYARNGGPIRLSVIGPICGNEDTCVGAIRFIIDPARFLYPEIQIWPTPSRSGESLLVRLEGNDVVYLNELRHRAGAALQLRLPAASSTLPAARAATVQEGILEGTDYRGVPVLAAVRRVANSPWFLITKIDKAEVYAGARARTLYFGAIVALVIVLGGFAVLVVWSRRDLAARRRAQESSRAAHEELKTIYENAPALLMVVDQDLRIRKVNEVGRRFAGRSGEQMLALRPGDAIGCLNALADPRGCGFSPACGQCSLRQAALAAIQDDSRSEQREALMPFSVNGERRTKCLLVSAAPVQFQQASRALICLQDVSELKDAQAALCQSEERLRLAADAAGIGVWSWTPATSHVVVSGNWRRLFGVDPDAPVTFETWRDALHPEDRDRAVRELRDASEHDREFNIEYRAVLPGGAVRWIIDRGRASYAPDGCPTGMAGVNVDITERKRAEHALRESEARFRVAQELSPDGFTILRPVRDGSGEVIDFIWVFENAAAARENGTDAATVAGKRLLELLPDYCGTEVFSAYADVAGSGRSRVLEARSPGQNISAWFRIVVVRMGADIAVLAQNITKHKESEESIRRLNSDLEDRVRERTAQLEAANKELEAFAYSVSHDLRAPLRGIDGWSLALVEDYGDRLDARGKQFLDRVRSEAQRMGLLIQDLLKLSRITRAEIHREPVDLSALAGTVAVRLQEAHESRRLQFDIQPGLYAVADARLVEIVLTNLMGNAVKFTSTRAHARIEVGHYGQNGGSVFYVRDNGVGFDMAYANTLFGAFQRLHKASEFPGTGIGLATVQRIVRRHGGRIWAEAQPDKGATFSFVLKGDP